MTVNELYLSLKHISEDGYGDSEVHTKVIYPEDTREFTRKVSELNLRIPLRGKPEVIIETKV